MNKLIRWLNVGLLTLVLTAGCASNGQKIEQDKVSQIKKGVTTRAEVEALLGPPLNVAMAGNGRRVLSYSYSESKVKGTNFIPYAGAFIGGTNSRQQALQIVLNENGIVEDYEFNDHLTDVTGGTITHQQTPKK